jgi:hypothetical protein
MALREFTPVVARLGPEIRQRYWLQADLAVPIV